ncbi:hypothetical protein ACJMK2_018802 [Sinanodonta woodiana]|uniref:Leucine-rich repeat-containing protein 63 n=1 Tax=Sinanodonta woodiana TaxID=1069815 RepID=A0ABD3UI33_SINWO
MGANLMVIPGLKSKKNLTGRLLRRPRPPKRLSPLPMNTASVKGIQEFIESFDIEALPESLTPPDNDFATQHFPSPTPSVVPSLVSPPPSESNPQRSPLRTTFVSPQSRISFLSREEKKYVLDPVFRDHTSLGTYVDGKSLVKPFKPRGPEPFPARPPRRDPEIFHAIDVVDDIRFFHPPQFTLDNFLIHIAEAHNIPFIKVREAVYSRHNYKRLTKIISEKLIPVEKTVHVLNVTPEDTKIPPAEPRIPQRQLLIEMAAMIKQHVREILNTEVKSVIKPLRKYSPSYQEGFTPHTEIILVEDDSAEVASRSVQIRQDTELPAKDAVFHSARSKFFQGSGRSQSPFTVAEEGMISPSELAVLDSLVNGGKALSLKAHFISELPDISPLAGTITYLNLSFNDFTMLPPEVTSIKQLEILKLRNNPLRELPADIHHLNHLRTLVVSFCQLNSLPMNIFRLQHLRHLDLSYNKLTFIQNEICHLQNLKEMNLEGNQLPAMPSGALRLHLDFLNVKNNYMHPLFWRENTQNEPQRLIDVACLTLYKTERHKESGTLPESVLRILKSHMGRCDCCQGIMFGPGLRIIRPVSKFFNIFNLPFMFRACSPECMFKFKHKTETLSEILYGKDHEMMDD